MADRKTKRQRELDRLKEDFGPYFHRSPQHPNLNFAADGRRIMSQSNRSSRGVNRINTVNSHGEKVQIWEACKIQMVEIVAGINAENDSLGHLVNLDKRAGDSDPSNVPSEALSQMEQLCRSGVKFSEGNISNLKAVMEQLKILRAVVVSKEQVEASSNSSSKRASARDNAVTTSYDFDGAGDSPTPNPATSSSRRNLDRSKERERDSIPPQAHSVEPLSQGDGYNMIGASTTVSGPATSGVATSVSCNANGNGSKSSSALLSTNYNNVKSKVVFSKGDAVAFKPKVASGEQSSDWILGEVAQVLGDGKSRRYKVLDIEPDDQSKQKEYRSSASSMIPITPEGEAACLRPWESGQVLLALYPNTTTFYKAEVHSMDEDGRVNLKFEGENDSTTLQQVERRFVIEYRA